MKLAWGLVILQIVAVFLFSAFMLLGGANRPAQQLAQIDGSFCGIGASGTCERLSVDTKGRHAGQQQ